MPHPNAEDASAAIARLKAKGQFVDDAHERLTGALLSWVSRHHIPLDIERSVKIAFFSAMFAVFCSPAGSPQLNLELAARLLVLFFLVDEAKDEQLAEHCRYVERTLAAGGSAPAAASLDLMLADITTALGAIGPEVTPFVASWLQTCTAMQRERRAVKQPITADELFEIRQSSVAVHAYTHLWYISYGLELNNEELLASARLRYLVTEEAILCNDLASIDKDLAEGADELNYALLLWRERNLPTLEAAADMVVARYNRQLVELAQERTSLLARFPGVRMERLIELALISVDGNVKAHRRLVNLRYSGRGLDRLSYLEPS